MKQLDFGVGDRGIGFSRYRRSFGWTAIRSATVWSAALSLLLQGGCATVPRPPMAETREQLGTVAIVPARYVPESNFVTFAKSGPGGMAKGAAVGAGPALAVGVPATVLTGGVAGGIIAVWTVLYASVYGAIGAVAGTMAATSSKEAREIEHAIADAVVGLDAQQTFAGHLVSAAQREPVVRLQGAPAAGPETPEERPSYGGLKAAGVDTVLEIGVTEIGFETCPQDGFSCPGKDRLIGVFVKARARLVRVADGTELYARTFWHESRPRRFQDWAENGGQPLAEAFELGWRELASRIVDELFLITPVSLPTSSLFATRSDPYLGHCWLRPEYPAASNPEVDSLQPQLRWEPFPRALDRERGEPALIARIRDVTYDLKIWERDDLAAGRLVYERTGLAEPSHRVEAGLEPDRQYLWSFRARFVLDGRPTAIRWASRNFSGSSVFGPRDESGAHTLTVCHSDQMMPWLYYRLVTPKD